MAEANAVRVGDGDGHTSGSIGELRLGFLQQAHNVSGCESGGRRRAAAVAASERRAAAAAAATAGDKRRQRPGRLSLALSTRHGRARTLFFFAVRVGGAKCARTRPSTPTDFQFSPADDNNDGDGRRGRASEGGKGDC